ncbi:hypothetical protein EB001_20265 [bacterium]|nr:hypothetical protein [bacterium]
MVVEEKISYPACNEAYCLLTAYLREEKIGAKYNKEDLNEFVHFLAEILKHPKNFTGVDRKTIKKEKDDARKDD